MALNLNALLQQMTNNAAARTQAIATAAASQAADTAAMQEKMRINVADAASVADAAATIARAEADIAARQQQAIVKGAAIVGLSPEDQENELVRSMAAYNLAESERKQVRAEFDRMSQISLLDNPIGFLAAQLKLPQLAQRNNALVSAKNAAADNISTRQALLAQHKSTVVANTVEETRQIAFDRAENARRLAEVQMREAAIDHTAKLSARRLQEFQLTNEVFDVDSDLISKKLQVGQYMLSLEERREARAERAAAAAARRAAQQEKDDDIARLNVQLQRISHVLGLPEPMTVARLKLMTDRRLQQKWYDAANTGYIGNDLIDSLKFIVAQGNPAVMSRNNPGLAKSIDGLTDGLESFISLIRNETRVSEPNLKDDEIRERAQVRYVNSITAAANDPRSGNSLTSSYWDKVFNPNRAQHLVIADSIAKNPNHVLANNQFADLIKTAIQAQSDPTAPNLLAEGEQRALRAMGELVRERKLTPDQAAASLAQYYRYAMAKNRDLFQYDLFNIAPQTRYFGQIDKLSWFGKPVTFDFSSESQAKKAFVTLARQTAPTAITPFGISRPDSGFTPMHTELARVLGIQQRPAE